jgi:hypothetical protein
MHAVGMISQCFVAHPAGHRATGLVLHDESNAILLQVLALSRVRGIATPPLKYANILLGQPHKQPIMRS